MQTTPAQPPPDPLAGTLRAALAAADANLAAARVCHDLAQAFDCQLVCVALRRGSSLQLLASSDALRVDQDGALARQVLQAMEECLDQGCSLRYPQQAADPPHITRQHAVLAAQAGAGALLGLPLTSQQRIVGALLLSRNAQSPWQDAERRRLEALAPMLGPVLRLQQRANETLGQHLRRLPEDFRQRLTQPGRRRLHGLLLAGALLIAGVSLWPVDETVSGPVRVEGRIQRSIPAPADGFIREVLVRPGSEVSEGQLLLTLADEGLRAEQGRLESELARLRSEVAEAFARQDRAAMISARARADEVAAQLTLLSDELARTRLSAPFAGIVLQGELQHRAGAPVRRGDVLLVIAPAGDYRLVLHIDERDIQHLRPGMQARLAFPALPGRRLSATVERLSPVASQREGRNGFEVEASLASAASGVLPGMEGHARIVLGERRLIALWGGRALDWLDFQRWRLLGN